MIADIPVFPYAAGRVVGAAKDGNMDIVLFDFTVHILVIHPPDTIFVLVELAVDDPATGIFHRTGKSDIGGGVQQNRFTHRSKCLYCGRNASQHAVFIADRFFGQTFHIMTHLLPVDDGIKIFLRRTEVAKCRMLDTFNDCLLDGGDCRKVHVGNPHRDFGITRLDLRTGNRNSVDSNGVLSSPVHNGRKIVFHKDTPFSNSVSEALLQNRLIPLSY